MTLFPESARNFKRHPIVNSLALAVCALALTFVLASRYFPTAPLTVAGGALTPVDPAEPALSGDGFAPYAVFGGITVPPTVTGVELYGSALRGDASMGQVRSRWYKPRGDFYLLLAGYPVDKGCRLFLETYTPGQGIRPVPIHLDQNPENWTLQKISGKALGQATKFRIAAIDASPVTFGWLGFSQPFTMYGRSVSELLTQVLLVMLCVAASLLAVLGPGIAARAYFRNLVSAVWIPVPGILLLAMLGLFTWKGPSRLPPELISRTGLLFLFLFVGLTLVRRPLSSLLSVSELRVLAFLLLVIAITVAKSIYSIGPSGDLYGGHISRTLEASERGDSRISYHVVQLIGLRENADGKFSASLFAPWSFSHRGPLAGLAASPIVLCPDVHLSRAMPDDRWTVFDPQGFASYRIFMIVMSAGALFIVFGLAALFLTEEWAILAFLCAAAAPFTIHEIFFTWPKLAGGEFVLLGAYLSLRRRFFGAGLAAGLGYLFHPSALLTFPALIALAVFAVSPKTGAPYRPNLPACLRAMALTCAGLVCWLVIWRSVNQGNFHQDSFLGYLFQAGALPPTLANWLHFRWNMAVNTFVPLHLFLYDRGDRYMLPPDYLANAWVQFVQQYWCTLAFGGGIVFYGSLLRLTAVAVRQAKPWLFLVFAPSLLLFILYFGAASTGLMREGLHGWFLGFVIFAVVLWHKHLSTSRIFWRFTTLALALRGFELLLVLVPFSSWTRGYILQRPYTLSDFFALATMLLGTAALTWLTVNHCRRLERSALQNLVF